MFEPTERPRIFGLPPGVDFASALVDGVLTRMGTAPPEALARVEIHVNTRRMQRRVTALFDAGPARLLPRIRLVTDLATEAGFGDIPPPVSPLRRRLELMQLVAGLLEHKPDLAPREALFDLADSLAALMDEMQGEGVGPEALCDIDVADQSGHWQQSLEFVSLVQRYFGAQTGSEPDIEARQRLVVERLAEDWRRNPPTHPVLVAGSTGSRGTTALFMRTVARLPQGALVLPGVDFDMPADVWNRLDDALTGEDHPQFRFARMLRALDAAPGEIRRWVPGAEPANPSRNRLVSLALRPAPVTDQWLVEGRQLNGIAAATERVALVEAPSPREEAAAVALVLRKAAEDGRSAALITPDRTLTRQVAAALDRWGIVPDDSAGRPLPLTAPGRFLRHVADLFGQRLTAAALLTLLKHPLTNSGPAGRGPHLLQTGALELELRRNGPPFPTAASLRDWGKTGGDDRRTWAEWVAGCIDGLDEGEERPLGVHLDRHIALAERLARGSAGEGSGELWRREAGEEALRWVDALRREADGGGTMPADDYSSLFHAVLRRGEVREAVTAHPRIMIWGTLEARVQGADLVVLAGLNEGTWPEPLAPDPWLNRTLRHKAGLLLPERQIGLAAHDFQQAVAADEVALTRAVRDAEAATVPSRWINRLTNLLSGLPGEGPRALDAMRGRGDRLLALARAVDKPAESVAPARRPSPRPPVADRPREISITEVQTLIRDPYAVYARRVLRLDPLDPLHHVPDPPTRGTLVHAILEDFIGQGAIGDPDEARARLLATAQRIFGARVAWPAARRFWFARLARVADWFVEGEIARQSHARPIALERQARLRFPDVETVLKGKIDRIDRLGDGRLAVYDYKTGAPPSPDQQTHFDKQLQLAALLVEHGAVTDLDAARVAEIGYVGLGASPVFEPVPLENGEIAEVMQGLVALVASYRERRRGYTSRRAMVELRRGGDYDHLARYGEWDETDAPQPQEVGP